MTALGEEAPAEDKPVDEASATDEVADAETDEAIDTFLDIGADPATRREAFRRAVQGCY